MKRIGIGVSKLGASKAAAIGAYQVATQQMPGTPAGGSQPPLALRTE